LRRDGVSHQIGEAIEDGDRSLAVELLIEDGLGEAVERGLAVFHAAGANALDDGGQGRVGLLQVENRFSHGQDGVSRIQAYGE
jgi:hypothetical protein